MAENAKPESELERRMRLFTDEFKELQDKYRLRAVAQVPLPAGNNVAGMITLPIQVTPYEQIPGLQEEASEDKPTTPDEA